MEIEFKNSFIHRLSGKVLSSKLISLLISFFLIHFVALSGLGQTNFKNGSFSQNDKITLSYDLVSYQFSLSKSFFKSTTALTKHELILEDRLFDTLEDSEFGSCFGKATALAYLYNNFDVRVKCIESCILFVKRTSIPLFIMYHSWKIYLV